MVKTQIDIRRAIMESGVNMAEVAERTGIDRSNLSKLWLKIGDREPNPTLSKLAAVADAIGYDITQLFFPVEDEQESSEVQGENFVEEDAKHVLNTEGNGEQRMQTMAFCPHCGAKVQVGVVLVPSGSE